MSRGPRYVGDFYRDWRFWLLLPFRLALAVMIVTMESFESCCDECRRSAERGLEFFDRFLRVAK